jgi:nitric oxide reductase NorQ protein
LQEGASTRTLIATARLIKSGIPAAAAARVAIIGPLSDDPIVSRNLREMAQLYMS